MCKAKSQVVPGGRYRCSGHARDMLESSLVALDKAAEEGNESAIREEAASVFDKITDYAKTNEGLYAMHTIQKSMQSGELKMSEKTAHRLNQLTRIAHVSAMQWLHAKVLESKLKYLNQSIGLAAERVEALKADGASPETVASAQAELARVEQVRREAKPFLEAAGATLHNSPVTEPPASGVVKLPGYDELSDDSQHFVHQYVTEVHTGYNSMMDRAKKKDKAVAVMLYGVSSAGLLHGVSEAEASKGRRRLVAAKRMREAAARKRSELAAAELRRNGEPSIREQHEARTMQVETTREAKRAANNGPSSASKYAEAFKAAGKLVRSGWEQKTPPTTRK